jgi:hypothetical protein
VIDLNHIDQVGSLPQPGFRRDRVPLSIRSVAAA